MSLLFVLLIVTLEQHSVWQDSFGKKDMALEVIGVGQGRTGTASVKVALEHIGIGRCYHMGEAVSIPGAADLWVEAADGNPAWEKIFNGFSAAVDNPICAFWRELIDYYQDAKILLTIRSAEKWFDSTQATIYAQDTLDFTLGTDFREFLEKTTYTFGDRVHNRDYMTNYFNDYNAEIIRSIPAERLLIFKVQDGWEPLCNFLDLPIPDIPFPHVNTKDEHKHMMAGMKAAQSKSSRKEDMGSIASEMFVDHKGSNDG